MLADKKHTHARTHAHTHTCARTRVGTHTVSVDLLYHELRCLYRPNAMRIVRVVVRVVGCCDHCTVIRDVFSAPWIKSKEGVRVLYSIKIEKIKYALLKQLRVNPGS